MTHRQRLPTRRRSEIVSFQHDGVKYVGRVARFGDGRIAEIFLDAGKVGTSAHILAKDAAVVLSVALQYGAPLEVIEAALSQELDGTLRGPIGMLLQLVQEGES